MHVHAMWLRLWELTFSWRSHHQRWPFGAATGTKRNKGGRFLDDVGGLVWIFGRRCVNRGRRQWRPSGELTSSSEKHWQLCVQASQLNSSHSRRASRECRRPGSMWIRYPVRACIRPSSAIRWDDLGCQCGRGAFCAVRSVSVIEAFFPGDRLYTAGHPAASPEHG